jgi:outer membrane protein assembly factor BamD (BamD/ComL family)
MLMGALFAVSGAAQQPPAANGQDKQQTQDNIQLPPEEDKAAIPQQYAFNPVQSNKEVQVGEFYFKKGDYKAAAGRFAEATKWNDGNAEAWLRLGAAQEKMNDAKAAREAWEKYLKLASTGKNADEIRKKLEKLR